MSFQPVIVGSGLGGWQFLQSTLAKQQATFDASPEMQRDTDYFTANIGKITNTDQLMADRRLLTVALGAFGLGDQINNTALIRKVLADGSETDTALANKLSDKRWLSFAQAFSFANAQAPATGSAEFAAGIVSGYQTQQFQTAVGQQDHALQLALGLQNNLGNLAASSSSEAAKWYTVMGTPGLRTVMETALGLPSSIVSLDIDRQLTMFEDKARSVFGDSSVSQFAQPEKLEKLTRVFLARSQLDAGMAVGRAGSAGSAALQLLQGNGSPLSESGAGILSLFR